jgi:hypothetical protein
MRKTVSALAGAVNGAAVANSATADTAKAPRRNPTLILFTISSLVFTLPARIMHDSCPPGIVFMMGTAPPALLGF